MNTQYCREDAKAHVLLVEDNLNDIDIMLQTLDRCETRITMDVVRDGSEALAYLKKEPPYTEVMYPDLILMDLNMPKVNGQELLQLVKADEHLKIIPVMVMTTSESEKDILKSYELQASCYLVKPIGLQACDEMMHALDHFWFSFVKYPPHDYQER